jgi:hypothetical protein
MKHLVALISTLCALVLVTGCNLVPNTGQSSPPTQVGQVKVPQQDNLSPVPAPQGTQQPANPIPAPVGTFQYPTPGITPTRPEPTVTPTHVALEPARLITATTSSTISLGLDLDFRVHSIISNTEAVVSLVWSPYGDGFLYLTVSGKLYWSDTTGANPTLLNTYTEFDEYFDFDLFEDQKPLGTAIYIVHYRGVDNGRRLPGHMDIVHFARGQQPTLEHAEHLPLLWGLQWWLPDRASALLPVSYTRNGYVGGDRLVTLDGNGRIVDDRNIPYMIRGVVQPNGEWLAYATDQQATDTAFNGSEPSTAYLLNLRTGKRLQISPSGFGGVISWSPDARWLITGCGVLSADGSERICMSPTGAGIGSGVVWSPDSKRLASYAHYGGCEDTGCTPYGSAFYVVDLPSRKMVKFEAEERAARGVGHVRRPKWSPDGSLMAVLAFDPACLTCFADPNQPRESTEPQPAIYLLSFDSSK